MFKRGKKGEEKEDKKKMTKKEKRLAAEMAEKAELMRAEGISMPDPKLPVVSSATPPTTPLRTPGGLLQSSQRSANRARERMGQQQKVKLSFKDRLTDKVASGQKSAPYPACDVRLLSPTL